MNDLILSDMTLYNSTLRFKKVGKNKYIVINKQGTNIGLTTGQSRYWYLRCFDLLRFHNKIN